MTLKPTRRLVPAAAVDAVPRSRVGVVLPDVVPTCLMVGRAAKHGALFLLEMMLRIRIGLVQCGLVGLSISLFALLVISVAEPLGFALSYSVSAGAVWAQASLYVLSMVRRPRLAAFAGVLGALSAFFRVVLSLDISALLAGAAGLFVTLSAAMAVTRRIEWAAS